jgi:hypothetical protein
VKKSISFTAFQMRHLLCKFLTFFDNFFLENNSFLVNLEKKLFFQSQTLFDRQRTSKMASSPFFKKNTKFPLQPSKKKKKFLIFDNFIDRTLKKQKRQSSSL